MAQGSRPIRPLLRGGADLGPAGAIARQWARGPRGAEVNGALPCAAFADSKSLCQLRNIKMYNAWFDLFIKLPCLGLFREESPREGVLWEGTSSEGLVTAVPGSLLHGPPVHGAAPTRQGQGWGQPPPTPQPRRPSAASSGPGLRHGGGREQVCSRWMRSYPGGLAPPPHRGQHTLRAGPAPEPQPACRRNETLTRY